MSIGINCDLKQGLVNKKAPKNKETLEQNMKSYMEMLSENPQRVNIDDDIK